MHPWSWSWSAGIDEQISGFVVFALEQVLEQDPSQAGSLCSGRSSKEHNGVEGHSTLLPDGTLILIFRRVLRFLSLAGVTGVAVSVMG